MGCVASVKVPPGVTQVATPEPSTGCAPQVPIVVPLSWKSTVPVGVPEVVETVAVNVTLSVGADGFFDETSAVVVPFLLTTCETVFDVLVSKVALALKTAVMLCGEPASLSVLITHCAWLELSATAGQMTVAPSLKSTVPVTGVTVVREVTVAVKVTLWPGVDGFGVEASVVVVPDLLTACETEPVLALNVASPA